jgi:dTDP-4-amino-4,6-dideoxygalactose transaminase
MKVPFVDLKGQYASIQEDIEKDVLDVLRSWHVVGGPYVQKFEEELAAYLGVEHVVGCSSGTDALMVAIEATLHKDKSKYTIVVPNNTFAASAFAITRAGYNVWFVDVDPNTYLIDIEEVKRTLKFNHCSVAAVMCVDLYGQIPNMDKLRSLCWAYDVPLIEDAAQSIGSTYNNNCVGFYSNVACTSFYPAKNLGTCGQGGAIITNNQDIANKSRAIINQGSIRKYELDYLGGNYRLDSIMAAQLRHALRKIDEWNDARRVIATQYNLAFGDRAPVVEPGAKHTYHLYEYKCDDEAHRQTITAKLDKADIAWGLHYPSFLPDQYQKVTVQSYARNWNTKDLHKRLLSLPIFPTMTLEQANYVIEVINS